MRIQSYSAIFKTRQLAGCTFASRCFVFVLLWVLLFNLLACTESLPKKGPTTKAGDIPIPANFQAEPENSAVTLTWDEVDGFTYTIYWTSDDNVKPIESDKSPISGKSSPYKHEGRTNGITYHYVLTANKDGKESAPTATVSATPSGEIVLNAPDKFEIVAGTRSLELSWNAVSDADGYKIFWTTIENQSPLDSSNIPLVTPNTKLVHDNLRSGLTYYYAVIAIADGGSRLSEPTEIKDGVPDAIFIDRPTNLASEDISDRQIRITWDGVANASNYIVYWSTSGPDFTPSPSQSRIMDNGETVFNFSVQPGNIYYFKVIGISEAGEEGEPSVALEVNFRAGPIISDPSVSIPTNLRIVVSGITVNIGWDTLDSSYNYKIFYATQPGVTPENYSELQNGRASKIYTTPQALIGGLEKGRKYYFVIVSLDGINASIPTEEKSFQILIPDADYEAANIVRGADLWEKWWDFSRGPKSDNPIWEDAAKSIDGKTINKSIADATWRCVECHGWDYKGRDGEYGVGSQHYTGFPGVLNAKTTKTKEEVFEFIIGGVTSNQRAHDFSQIRNRDSLDMFALVKFIMEGTVDVGNPWDGDPQIGAETFVEPLFPDDRSCSDLGCHKENTSDINKSRLLNFAINEPSRFLHYVRYGTGFMPSGRASVEDGRNILTYMWTDKLSSLASNFEQAAYEKTDNALLDQWAQGGVLYDRWNDALTLRKKALPKSNHPLWPSADTIVNGSDTWRCKECHGWDYQGSAGAYGSGNHFTGIKGIVGDGQQYTTSQEIYDFLRSGGLHGFSDYIADTDIYALTRFVEKVREESVLQQSPQDLIDTYKEEPKLANVDRGFNRYKKPSEDGGCETCHIKDGQSWFFSDNDISRGEIQTVASIAKENPWEFLHKIRFGHPGSSMLGLVQIANTVSTDAIDILAYSQTTLAPNLKRGGRLYDRWWKENLLNEPDTRHTLWPIALTNTSNIDTWRCVTCHGWDYQGDSGFTGLFNPISDVKEFILNGTVIDANDHGFADLLKQQDIADLTEFVTNPDGQGLNKDLDTLIIGADSIDGQLIYENPSPGNCINCHGENGTSIPNVDLRSLVSQDKNRFLHRARFGFAGGIMRPTVSRYVGLTPQESANVLSFIDQSSGGTPNTAKGNLDRGGRLFDNWFVEMRVSDNGVKDPVVENPLWQERDQSVPDVSSLSDSWRCVSCHNWNYRGKDLLSNRVDADNLLVRLKSRRSVYPDDVDLSNYLVTWIKNGIFSRHNYGDTASGLPTVLGDAELQDLAKFLIEGVIDTSDLIENVDGSVITSDPLRGKEIYSGNVLTDVNCITCHGETGEGQPPGSSRTLDIFNVAKDNPWLFLHKTRFSVPNTDMPALSGLPDADIQHALDILGYAQESFSNRVP